MSNFQICVNPIAVFVDVVVAPPLMMTGAEALPGHTDS